MDSETFEIAGENDLRSRFNGQYATCESVDSKLGNFAKSEAQQLQEVIDDTGLEVDEALEISQDL